MAGKDKRFVDPMFYIPEGMDDDTWVYREDANSDIDSETTTLDATEGGFDDFEVVEGDVTIIDEGDASEDDAPLTVDNLTVVSQVLRRAADGTQVVDLVVEVDDVPGINKYEFRVTKV